MSCCFYLYFVFICVLSWIGGLLAGTPVLSDIYALSYLVWCVCSTAGLPLQQLALFDAVPPRAVAHLAAAGGGCGGSSSSILTQQLTALTLGSDPSTHNEGLEEDLQLSKTRTVNTLFGALAEPPGRLQVLSVPCTGLCDAQAKVLAKLGSGLRVLNVSYNSLSAVGLRVLRELAQLERLELRAMRPELRGA